MVGDRKIQVRGHGGQHRVPDDAADGMAGRPAGPVHEKRRKRVPQDAFEDGDFGQDS